MQAVILSHQDSLGLRQLVSSGIAGQLPLHDGTSKFNMLQNLVHLFQTSAGIPDPIIVCRTGQSAQLEKLMKNNHCTFLEVPSTLSVPECIYRLRDRLTSSYVFLTYGDVAFTDLPMRDLFITMVRKRSSMVSVASPKPAGSKLSSNDLFFVNEETGQLVHYFPASDIKKQIKLPKAVIAANPNIVTRCSLQDVGFYLLSSYAVKVIESIR